MLDAPFLELAWYVGKANLSMAVDAIRSIVPLTGSAPKFAAPDAVGIAGEREQLVVRGGVLELRTEGEVFCGPLDRSKPRAKILGERVFQRFVSYVDVIRPLYGAILIEYSLEDPDELRKDPRSLAFTNFYLSKRALGQRSWHALDDLLDERIYRREVSAGRYFSMSSCFNPDGKMLPPTDAQELSAKIGKILASSLREGH